MPASVGFETVRSRISCPEARASSIARVSEFGASRQFVRWENIEHRPVETGLAPSPPPPETRQAASLPDVSTFPQPVQARRVFDDPMIRSPDDQTCPSHARLAVECTTLADAHPHPLHLGRSRLPRPH